MSFLDGTVVLEEANKQFTDGEVPTSEDNSEEINLFSLEALQEAVLIVLKKYWLQKYMLHLMYEKQRENMKPTIPMLQPTLSDAMLQDNMQSIDFALKMAQGKPLTMMNEESHQKRAEVNWRSLFPHQLQVDDKFLSTKDEVVTVHDDGKVSINPTDPNVMDKVLLKYTLPPERSPSPSHSGKSTPGIRTFINLSFLHFLMFCCMDIDITYS